MTKFRVLSALAAAVLLTGTMGVRAQEISSVRDCSADLKSVCAGVGPNQQKIEACMQQHMSELSVGCSSRLSKMLWVGNECSADIEKFCPKAKYGSIGDCMRPHLGEVSDTCKAALAFIVSPAAAE